MAVIHSYFQSCLSETKFQILSVTRDSTAGCDCFSDMFVGEKIKNCLRDKGLKAGESVVGLQNNY